MTKEEKIKEAWLEFWDRLTEYQKEHALKNNGNVQIGYSNEKRKYFKRIRKLGITQNRRYTKFPLGILGNSRKKKMV